MPYLRRVYEHSLCHDTYLKLKGVVKAAAVTREFRAVVDLFKVPEGETPAGFRVDYWLEEGTVLKVDLPGTSPMTGTGSKGRRMSCFRRIAQTHTKWSRSKTFWRT